MQLTGLAKNSKREQLANFAAALNRYGNGEKYTKPRTWFEAFDKLRELLISFLRLNIFGTIGR